jgi:hypothetical protein
VSLHGSLETFALPDVLSLLSSTQKSGELRVVGGRLDGKVWVDHGKVVGSEVGRSTTIVDAVFELLRLASGTFSFESDRPAPSPSQPVTIEPVLAEAQSRLVEWRQIEAVVPSLEALVTLAAEAPNGEVTIRADQWRMLVAAGEGRPVGDLMERLGTCEFDTCRALKELVEGGLVAVAAASVAEEPVQREEPAPPAPLATLDDEGPGGSGFGGSPVDEPPPGGGLYDGQRLNGTVRPAAREGESDLDSLVEIPSRFRRHQASASAEGGEDIGDDGDRGAVATILAAARHTTTDSDTSEAEAETATTEPARVQGHGGAGTANGTVDQAGHGEDELIHDGEDGEEPINRGLLLKFLSSVRS